MTVGDIQAGIEVTREQDAAKAAELEPWLQRAEQSCAVLPMDAATLRVWGQLMHRASDTLYEDAMIAATAQVQRLTVVTRNVADFKDFGGKVVNPFWVGRQG